MFSKILLSGFSCIFLMMAAQGQERKPDLLFDYQWENRLLLIFAPGQQSELYKRQVRELRGDEPGLKDRDMKIFNLFAEEGSFVGDQPLMTSEAETLYQQYEIAFDEFAVMLIGKDGTEKLRQHSVLATQKLFAVIDAMPMRRREMRQRDQ